MYVTCLRHRLFAVFCVFLMLASGGVPAIAVSASSDAPNVVLVLADDLGYGDIGSYGASDILTPNIDRLATEGVMLSGFHVEPSCGPTRATLMTGSYFPRVSLARNQTPSRNSGLHSDEITLAELLRNAGYATGLFGKWHLGDHYQYRPQRHGFDEFFGIPYSNSMWPFHPRTFPTADEDPRLTAARERAEFTGYAGQGNPYPLGEGWPNLPLYDGDTIVEFNSDQTSFGSVFFDRALDFIERHSAERFFAYIALPAPHVPLHPSAAFAGSSSRDLYGDTLQEIDHGVGRILAKLVELGIDNQTLVIFLSDNGPWLEYGIDGGSAGVLTGGKGTYFEGGTRVPALLRWPGELAAGTLLDDALAAPDILPTLANLVGASVATDRTIDGVDIWPLLTGQVSSLNREAIFSFAEGEFETVALAAVISGDWKLHVSMNGNTVTADALYNLSTDITESIDRSASEPGVVSSLLAMGQQIFDDVRLNQRPLGQVSLSGEPFMQKEGAGDLISIEAENYHERQGRGGQEWQRVTVNHNSGNAALQALPNNGVNISSDYASNSPHLGYRISVDTPGRYYVWVRGRGQSGRDDSLHIGLDGQEISSGFQLSNINDYWTWTSTLMEGGRSFVDIGTAGEYMVDVWMREDGVIIDKIVLTTDEFFEPAGKGPVESQQGVPSPALQFSTASLAFNANEGDTTPLSQGVSLDTSDGGLASFTLSSSAPAWLSASPASGDTPAGTVTVTANPSGLSAGTYTGTITATATGYGQDSIDVTLTVAGSSVAFQQDAASGLLSIEVEHVHNNVSQGGHDWIAVSDSGASGSGSLQALPNTGTNNNTGYVLNSPRLGYVVNFTQVGTHYVWIRGKGATTGDDSVHVGLNGAAQASADRISGFGSAWTWTNDTMDGVRATLEVTTTGEQVLNIWMREDGVVIDKIVLSTDAGLRPASFGILGPPESPQGVPAPALQFSTASLAFNANEGDTTPLSQGVSLDTSDGGLASFTLSSSAPAWLSASPASGDTPAGTVTVTANPSGLSAGTYTGTITATATGYGQDSIDVTLAVAGSSAAFEYQMEDGAISGSAIIGRRSSGFTGDGYVRYQSAGATVEHAVNVPAAGSYELTFRYGLGSGQVTGQVAVDGQIADPNLLFTATGSWTNWQTATTTVDLEVGTHPVALSVSGLAINVDSMVVTPR